jgi:uncharacterized protein
MTATTLWYTLRWAATSLNEVLVSPGQPGELVLRKEMSRMEEHGRAFIAPAQYLLLSTAGASGRCGVLPHGDAPSFALVAHQTTIFVADRSGIHRRCSVAVR